MVVLGTTNGWLASALTVVAVRHLDTSIVAMIQAVVPLIVLVLAHFLFAEERFRIGQFAGILMGLLGILLIIGPLAVFGGRGSLIGIGAMLLTAFCFACGTVYGRHISGTDTTILACGQQACGAVIAAVISVLIESSSIGLQPARVWVLLAVVGILCSALPTVLYLRLLTKAASVPAALVAYLQPVWAMLLGCAVLGESISAAALFGAGLVISGIFTTTIANKTESPAFWRRITWLINAINRLPISRGPAADQETARLGPGRLGASESPAARSVSEAALTS
jgi:drug/metabolite transporter (DMT)-like permease